MVDTMHDLEQIRKAVGTFIGIVDNSVSKPVHIMDNLSEERRALLRETITRTSTSFETLYKPGSPSQVAQHDCDVALGHMRELAELVTKSQQDYIDTINRRIAKSMDEIKQRVSTKTGPTVA